jgi:hypothetical protein
MDLAVDRPAVVLGRRVAGWARISKPEVAQDALDGHKLLDYGHEAHLPATPARIFALTSRDEGESQG